MIFDGRSKRQASGVTKNFFQQIEFAIPMMLFGGLIIGWPLYNWLAS